MKFLIEGVLIDFDEIAIADLYYPFKPEPTWDNVKPEPIDVVRIQLKNRRDEIKEIGGKPIQLKHGVFELSPTGSETFRWWLKWFGPRRLNTQNLDELYENRQQIERLLLEQDKAVYEQVKKETENE